MPKTRLTVPDVLLVAGLLVLAVLLLLPRSESGENAVFVIASEDDSKRTKTEYPLWEDTRITVHSQGVTMTVVCENGRVRVENADCPDGICMKTGSIGKTGESIVCLPAKTAVTVKNGKQEAPDADFIIG